MTFPDGTSMISSPQNRRRASELWKLDNKSKPVRVDDEDDEEEIEKMKRELNEQREEFEKERERDREERAKDEYERLKMNDELMNDKLMNDERLKMNDELINDERLKMKVEIENLKMKLAYEEENKVLRERLMAEIQLNAAAKRPADCGHDVDVNNGSDAKNVIKYSLALNHPDADIMSDLANCVPLSSRLKQMNTNDTARISTVTDFFTHVNTKQPGLQLILKNRNLNSSLRFVINSYRNAFFAVKHPDDLTMAVCLLKAISVYCSGMKGKIRAAVSKAASMCHADRLQEITAVEKTGLIGSINSETQEKKLAELTGMQEIMNATDCSELVKSFEDFILAHICFEKNLLLKMKNAENAWASMPSCGDCDELIDDESKLFGICTGWKKENICTDYHRFLHMLSLAPKLVNDEYAAYISSPFSEHSENDVMFKSWDQYLEILRTVWNSAQSKDNISQCMSGHSGGQNRSYADMAVRRPRVPAVQREVRRPLSDIGGQQPGDIMINCEQCKCDFNFTVKDQEFHAGNGWQNDPKSCSLCKDKGRPCKLLSETGECRFGDNCKYSHATVEHVPAGFAAWNKEREKVAEEKKRTDRIPEEGFTGLAVPKSVRFDRDL